MRTMYLYAMVVAVILLGCTSPKGSMNTRYTAEIHTVGINEHDSLLVEIEVDTCERGCSDVYLYVRNKGDSCLFDASGVGGADLPSAYDSSRVLRCNFDKDSIPEFAVYLGIHGSTYGAGYVLIIWFVDNMWHVDKTPFDRGEIEDVDNDGIQEIVDYPANQEKTVYTFSRGCFSKK